MLYHSKAKLEKKRRARVAARFDLSGRPTPEEKVRRLIRMEPSWGPVLRECLVVAEKRSGKFAGAWVIQGLHANGLTPPNNLRTLSSVSLLKLTTTTRAGNRAYYSIPDAKSIARALKDLGY